MSPVHEKTQLLAHFLESETRIWVRFVPAVPLDAAYYYDAHFGGGVLHRYLLHLTTSESTEQRSCRIALEIGSHTPSQGGLILDVTSTRRDIAIDASGSDLADANWPTLEDPLVRKAYEIVQRCKHRFGPPPSTGAIYRV